MKLQEAIEFIENFEVPDKLKIAGRSIKDSLVKLKEDEYEEIGTHFYYLLRVVLRNHILFEKDIAKYYYRKMVKSFLNQEEVYLETLKNSDKKEVARMQMNVFYQLMERYFSSLEVIYDKKDFREAKQRAYLEKVNFRKKAHLFKREYVKYTGYHFLDISSHYGTSFMRWGITSLVFIVIFGALFAVFKNGIEISHWYDYFYFSATTFTTLGYGDIAPLSISAKILANIEAFSGFIMLGIFIGLIQKKLL